MGVVCIATNCVAGALARIAQSAIDPFIRDKTAQQIADAWLHGSHRQIFTSHKIGGQRLRRFDRLRNAVVLNHRLPRNLPLPIESHSIVARAGVPDDRNNASIRSITRAPHARPYASRKSSQTFVQPKSDLYRRASPRALGVFIRLTNPVRQIAAEIKEMPRIAPFETAAGAGR